ncbi:M14 family metallopeptidase [Christiangramia sediminis]|uniref:M14 family metallopeptidase n=1 Tax=Christiangramia sediminis TaxID=2881336 RepID=A0A9X1LKF8_9FLAO|nr:M14 family metallopeptidase [Christiangramia sediminis]MCB7481959.1 M14 family metallopeptidase [Christiangramia sediminis]
MLLSIFYVFNSYAQQDYPTNRQVEQRLKQMAASGNAKLISLTKTEGGQDIWALQLGKGDMENKPAIAITGGVEGYHLLSVELALKVSEKILEEHSEILDETTFYVFPNMSPDAYAQYFSNMKYERRGNSVKADQDRDGEISEDSYEDLNNDGWISSLRVESPMGNHVLHQSDARVLVKADETAKRDDNRYMVYSEGIDNDKDKEFNEDPEEGIAFNKSLTYKFPYFEPYAGDFPVSQRESRALLDYLFERWNIFAFVTFGPANNLSTPLKYNKSEAEKRVVTSMLEKDVKLNEMISEIYKETIPQKANNQDNQGTGGDFFQWAYFHFGRLSFSTPGWWVPEVKDEKADNAAKTDSVSNGKIKPSPETNFLAWAEKKGLKDVFLPWTEVNHPDFPNQKVEVGGLKPFVMVNPPYEMTDSIASNHTDFIIKLAEMQPKLELHNLKTEELGGGLTRITVDLFNNSTLPTHSELGEKSRWLQKLQIRLSKDKKDILAGNIIKLVDKLEAYEKQTLSWIVKGGGTATLRIGAPHTGFATMNIKL